MSNPDAQPNQPTGGLRVRRAYLALVLGGPWVLMATGVALIVGCFLSTQPTALRATGLIAGVVLLIVGSFMVRFAGPLEVSVPQGGVKATVDAVPRETLLLAERAVAQVLPGDDPDRHAVAARAVLDALRLERTAEILAGTKALLTDAHPDRLAFNAGKQPPAEVFGGLDERWQRIRVPLLTVAAADSDARIRDLAGQLEVAVANMLNQGMWLVSDVLAGRDLLTTREDAVREHKEATRLLDKLLAEIHRA
jgi:hypothetical protein